VNSFTHFQGSLSKYSFIPTYQNFPRHPEEEGIYDKIVLIMTELAEQGKLMVNFEKL
jgi:hypothetical protein